MAAKRILLVIGVALVVSGGAGALAALTAADESGWWWWYDHDVEENPMPQKPKTVTPTGDITLIVGAAEFGPCENVQLDGELFNDPMGNGEGEFLEPMANGEECATSLPGCTVEESRPTGFPWGVKLESATEVVVSGIDIETEFSEGCKKYGLPATSTASGTVSGEFSGYVEEKEGHETTPTTFVFNESPGLTVGGVGAKLDGIFTFGTNLTAEFIPL